MRLLIPVLVASLLVGCGRPLVTPMTAPDPAPVSTVVARSKSEQILDAIVRDVLESEFLESTRADYGTPGDKRIALVSNANYGTPWSAKYRPEVHDDYEVLRVVEGAPRAKDQNRILGIRINKFDLDQKNPELFREPIVVTVMNAGGMKNGAIIGGCSVYYLPVRKGTGWGAESTRLQDP